MSLPAFVFYCFFIHTHAQSITGETRIPCLVLFTCASTLRDYHRHQPSCVVFNAPYRLSEAPRGAQLQPGHISPGLATAQALEREHHSCPSPRSCRRRLVQVGDMILHRFHNFFEGSLPVWDHQRQEVATESGHPKMVRKDDFVCRENRCEPRHSVPVSTFLQ